MVEYKNGYIPDSLLITFNVGVSAGEGLWKHQLSAGTYAKHLALVALAKRNTGRTLTISTGWGAYRPYAAQVYARKVHGNGAATPGTSSHGGFWERQQTLAIDYGNWSYVYNGSRTNFYRDVRAVGLEPGLIVPARGYPDEPWHVVDKQPWAAPASGAGEAEGDMPFNEDDIKVLNGMGQSIKDDVINALKADIASVHTSVIGGTNAVRADLNYMHVLSPVSLKRIFETQTGALFTDAQLEVIGEQLAAASVAGIEAALKDDFEGVKARLAQLPAETIAALKSAL